MKSSPLFFLCCLLFSFSVRADQIEFHPGSFASAKNKAAESGRPLLVAFLASWSSSCRKMQQLVFTNDALAEYVNPRYVAVQVDVDDFDGLALKERFRIKELPSFLLFDEQGKFLSRSEGDMTADQMRRWLSDYAQPSAMAAKGQVQTYGVQAVPSGRLDAPENAPRPEASPATPTPVGELYELQLKAVPPAGYSVQLGVFSTLDNAARAMRGYEKKVEGALTFLLYAREEKGLDRYKLLTGRYGTRSEAQQLVNKLAKKGVKSFVKPLQEL